MAPAEGIRTLIERHAPDLRYHPLDPYRADSPATMTDCYVPWQYSNHLTSRDQGRIIASANSVGGMRALSLSFLVGDGEEYWSGGPTASANDSLIVHDSTRQRDSQEMHARAGYGNVTYCNWLPREGRARWLQYWLFYYDNPAFHKLFGHHEGDWEVVQVELDDSGEPVAAVYHQHDGAVRREWPDVKTVDDAGVTPIVYVAKGSHASYFGPGTQHRIAGFANDHTSDGGDRCRPEPRLLDEAVEPWSDWPGRWGDSEGSPQGPKYHGAWSKPEEVKAPKGTFGAALEDEVRAAIPAAPIVVSAVIEDDSVVVEFELATRLAEGESDPARLELAAYGGAGLPTVGAYDVTALRGTVRQSLPPAPPPYRLEAGVYDADENERLLPTIELTLAPAASLEDRAVPQRVAPLGRPSRTLPGTDIRVSVRAPSTEAQAELARRAANLELPDGPWQVRPLFDATDDPELARWFTVAGAQAQIAGRDAPTAALEAAHSLDLGEDWLVEPELPISSYRPDPERDQPAEAALADADDYAWALDSIRARAAWKLDPPPGGQRHGAGILIGQPDTGYTDHQELEEGAIDKLRAYDVLTATGDGHAVLKGAPPFAFPSHGTSTASVVGSRDSGLVTGSAPGATVIPVRAAASVVHFFNADLAVAVEHARMLGVHVITMSMGGFGYPSSLRAAIRRAVADGVIVMAAAGQPLPVVVEPARFPECLGIGGTVRGDKWWNLSARGREVDIAAPAEKVWVAATTNDDPPRFHVAQHTGTSFSVALVAGAAALWLAYHGRNSLIERYGAPNMHAAFRSLLTKTASKPEGWDTAAHGAGIVDDAALLGADLDEADVGGAVLGDDGEEDAAEWALDRIAELAEDRMSADQARDRAVALFGGDRAALARFSRELVYRLAEDGAVRDEVLVRPGAALEEQTDYPRLAALASPGMRSALS